MKPAARLQLPFLAAACVLVAAISGPPAKADATLGPPPVDWSSTLLTDHPLAGRIWSAAEGKYVQAGELPRRLAGARYILLGETHDNADHHRWQAWLVASIAKLKAKAAPAGDADRSASAHGRVALEMVRLDKAPQIPARPASAKAFSEAVQWDKSGWPSFAIYEPVVSAALSAGFRLVAAGSPREMARAVSKEGLAALGAGEQARLGLAGSLSEPLTQALSSEIRIAHCNMMPDNAIGGMVNVQRYRDALMADALIEGDDPVSILIAGSGHVRRDRGVPWYLEARRRGAGAIATVVHLEVEDGKTDPAAYVLRDPDGRPAVDFIVFTPAAARPDPCEKLKSMPMPGKSR